MEAIALQQHINPKKYQKFINKWYFIRLMRLSKTELELLRQVSLGNNQALGMAETLKKDVSQVYRIIRNLQKKGFASLQEGTISPSEATHVMLLLQVLSEHPGIIRPLSGCGIELFSSIIEPRFIGEIVSQTGIKRSTVYCKLKETAAISLINTAEEKFFFNGKIWPKARDFLIELKKHGETTDSRIPPGSIIYHKSEKEIVFSTRVECNAALTGFSAYGQYGIKLMTVDYNYYLPRRKLAKQEVFLHSIYRAEKEEDARSLTYIALFYIKHRKDLGGLKHGIISNINKILQGERILNYPSLAEIKDRAGVYDIEI
ncbi:MAG: hypothetical protein HY518_02660 [Candidatus Aenigmarchaeota archaeon]|nr:hypothetical protein [Candidatus Aenigmarchaeota archaeon]